MIRDAGMNNQQVQRRGGTLSLAATLRQKEKTPAVAVLNRQLTGVFLASRQSKDSRQR